MFHKFLSKIPVFILECRNVLFPIHSFVIFRSSSEVRHNSVFHEKRKLQKEIKNERGIRINKDREKKGGEKTQSGKEKKIEN